MKTGHTPNEEGSLETFIWDVGQLFNAVEAA